MGKLQWLDRKEYPFKLNTWPIESYRLNYIDEGSGETLVFVHGTPSWSFDFRNVIRELSKDFRCMAMDHIGFGLSEKPHEYDYTTINHSKNLTNWILGQDLNDITLIVHDFGGPIGLNFAINYPERVKRLVILNTWLWSSEGDQEFEKIKKVLKNPLLPFLYRQFNFSAKFLLPGSFANGKKPDGKILRQYTKPFADNTQREGTLAFAKSLVNDQSWFQKLWDDRTAISNKPTLLIWGMQDPLITPKYLEKFVSGFSNARLLKLEACGHFPQEEEAEKVIIAIREFIK